MKLIVPHTGEVQAADARLIHLAEFLGVTCEPLYLAKEVSQLAEYIERATPDRNSCLVINPQVIRNWIGGDTLPANSLSSLVLRFPYALMHALSLDPFVGKIVASVSGGKLQSVLPIADATQSYEISSSPKDICGPFSGLSFGPINAENDRVLALSTDDSTLRRLICIGGQPNMVAVRRDQTEILFLATEDLLDVNCEIGPDSPRNYFSRLMPHAMALRHIFGEESWHPCKSHASIIIDDPLLRQDYGYLNFESLLRLTEQHNFHTTISFIPHNYRRNSKRIVRMFRENPIRLSISFHGNDHTDAEFASTNPVLLKRMLGIAEERMNVHEQVTGLHCDRVMVFPQDNYSIEAMKVLKSRNFRAATSGPYPVGEAVPLTIADFAQPAVLRYAGFPLFTRSFIKYTSSEDIAFNIFFGKPILVGEHHDAFKHPESLLELVRKINSIGPGISWSNLENIADNSILKKRTSDGTILVRPYSNKVCIENNSNCAKQYYVEWRRSVSDSNVEQVLRDGTGFPEVEMDDEGIRILTELPPGASQIFSIVYRNEQTAHGELGFMWDARAYLRRRLSEVRDNYLSRNQPALKAAKALQRRFLKRWI
jgi:hypothetical protein